MKESDDLQFIEDNLLFVLKEMEAQPEVGASFPPDAPPHEEQMAQIREFIEYAGEYGLGYECINYSLEHEPYRISGAAAVKLLEIGLLMGFKTEDEKDKRFDRRQSA